MKKTNNMHIYIYIYIQKNRPHYIHCHNKPALKRHPEFFVIKFNKASLHKCNIIIMVALYRSYHSISFTGN